ncbi:substrate-binding periplasmic protein [Thalassotalea euphylliae]|uniref:substrate-binding periplasmic protein n=1 Tax=Thalassotalea euphylliae TaxID=1655234 RepID=UPI0036435420
MKFSVLCLLSFFILVASAQAKQEDIVACIDDHPPYQYLAEVPYGTHIAALQTLAKILDRNLVYVRSPNFARCVAMLKSGEVDVVAGLNITEERKAFAFWAPFKMADELNVITKKDITIEKYDDFRGKIIGIPRGSTYFYKFDNDDTLNKVSIQSERVGFSLILKERIDLIMASQQVLDSHITDIKKAELKISPISLYELRAKETYFGFSKKHRLSLSDEEIAFKTLDAFKRGVFLLPPEAEQ